MSKPKKRRRVLLPILLASGLTTAAGVGGYQYFGSGNVNTAADAQSDLDAGFEAAQGNDTLGAVAAAFADKQSSSEPRYANLDQVAYEPESPPVTTSPPIAAVPASAGGDRYGAALLAGPEEIEQLAPLPSEPIAPATSDRYGGAAPLAPLESTVETLPANDVPIDPVAVDESYAPEEPVARGQSPTAEEFAVEPLPENNPLRAAPHPFGQVPTSASAQEAFAKNTPAPDDNMDNFAAAPGPGTTANSLRSAAPQPAAMPEPAEFGGGARPLADANYDQQYQPQPSEQLAPITDLNPAERSVLSSQPAGDNYQRAELAPLDPPPSTNQFDPIPNDQPLAGNPSGEVGVGRPGERALEGPQRPALVLQKFAPQEIQVGKNCKFSITVRNVGQRPADNVVVTDEVPQGAQFVSASPQAEASGGALQWRLGTLSPNEERTLEIELMPTDEGEIGSVAQVTFASHASAKARCTRPQIALRMTAASEVLVGRQQRVTIELHNPGTGDATGVVLFENVPDNVRHQAGPALEFEVGTLRAGETRRMELVLTAEKPGRVVNVLTARADGNLQVEQEVEFNVIAPAISVEVDGPTKRYLERPATYTVSVENPGTATAKDVQLVTKLPKGMQFVRANNMGEYDSATHSVFWSLAELPEGQKGTVEVVALPVQAGDHTLEVEGRAREGLEDRTKQDIRVEGLAAIMFEVHDSEDPIEIGGSTSYDIRVVNQGSKAASNVRVSVLLPPGMKVTGATGETRHSVEAEGVIFEPLARLAPKADTMYRVQVQGAQAGDQRILVEVGADDITQPIRKEESTRVFGDE